MAASDLRQRDLLSWTPPEPAPAFDPTRIRGATLEASIARAVAECLRQHDARREDIAFEMGRFLGCTVSVNMLNAYASEARVGHPISLERFIALMHVTHDARLLQAIAEPSGFAVIERRYLPLIELALLHDHEDRVAKRRKHLQAQARAEGML